MLKPLTIGVIAGLIAIVVALIIRPLPPTPKPPGVDFTPLHSRAFTTAASSATRPVYPIEQQLAAVIPSVDLEEATLDEALNYLRKTTHANIEISPSLGSNPDVHINIHWKEVTGHRLLRAIISYIGLHVIYTVDENVATILSAQDSNPTLVLQSYDIRDLLKQDAILEFPPPDDQNTRQAPPVSSKLQARARIIADWIQQDIGRGMWLDYDRHDHPITYFNGRLFIIQSPEIHYEIARFLADLRNPTK